MNVFLKWVFGWSPITKPRYTSFHAATVAGAGPKERALRNAIWMPDAQHPPLLFTDLFQLHHSFLFMHSGDYWNLCGYKESLFLSLQFWCLHLGGVWGPGSISALLQSSPKSSLGKKTFWLKGKMKQLPQEQ